MTRNDREQVIPNRPGEQVDYVGMLRARSRHPSGAGTAPGNRREQAGEPREQGGWPYKGHPVPGPDPAAAESVEPSPPQDQDLDPQATLTLPLVLDVLARKGFSFDLEKGAGRPVLVFDPPLDEEAARLLDPWLTSLAWVALGRISGHVVGVCDRCGSWSMVSVKAGTPMSCRMCEGGTRVVDRGQAEEVWRVRQEAQAARRRRKRAR